MVTETASVNSRATAISGSVSWALLAAGVIVFLSFCWLLFPLTVDDAYISFRYSDNLATGHGLVWNVGEAPVEGYTNFLWVLLGAGVLKLGCRSFRL